jgi:AcrR family transcriptional regulator
MGQSTVRRSRGITREQILDVALELFNEQGYDKTSLREIAQRLGVTKAALYYHFERKEDLLLELHLRLHDLGRGILDELDTFENEQQVVAAWPRLLDRFIDEVLANRNLFLFHQRNERALHTLADNEQHRAENDDLVERFRRFLGNPAIPLADRVRMTCSVTGVLGGLMAGDNLYGDGVPIDELAADVRAVIADLYPRPTKQASAPA